MTGPGGGDRSDAERLAEQLRAFTEEEAASLDALAADLARLRGALDEPAFDTDAIWEAVAARLEEVAPPAGSGAGDQGPPPPEVDDGT